MVDRRWQGDYEKMKCNVTEGKWTGRLKVAQGQGWAWGREHEF